MTKRAFTQAELRRAVDAARACGLEVGAVEIDRNGTIRILMASAVQSRPDPFEEFEREEAKRRA